MSDTHRSDLCLICRENEPDQSTWRVCQSCQDRGHCQNCGGFCDPTAICPICFPSTSKAALLIAGDI